MKGNLVIYRWIAGHPVSDDFDQKVPGRWYRMRRANTIWVVTNRGSLRYHYREGFYFDGRSGGPLVDIVLPNLGTEDEIICWLLHDLNAYGTFLGFSDTNEMLRQMLRKIGKCRAKASLAHWTVSRSSSWYGEPKHGEREYINVFPEQLFQVYPYAQVNMA
jgi:hypothetical protein